MFGSILIKFSLSNVTLILGVPNCRELIDIKAIALRYMFEKLFRDQLSSR